MDNTIGWTCGSCHEPVRDGAGYVGVSYLDIDNYDRARQLFERDHPGPLELLTTYPDRARWEIRHSNCDPLRGGDHAYRIDVERLRTALHALDWATHMSGKSWIQATNWTDVLRLMVRQLKAGTTSITSVQA